MSRFLDPGFREIAQHTIYSPDNENVVSFLSSIRLNINVRRSDECRENLRRVRANCLEAMYLLMPVLGR